ncbi:MAG: ABC transporter permease, partial [Pyrinomonadaceae bacterium]|nr:ABC transporter permease [Pyrinomonadaceae bacterium]
MSTLWQDVRYGARMLFKAPGFTLVAVLSLALGIGVNTTIFSMVNALILRPLPYEEPGRLVVVQQTQLRQEIRGGVVSLGDFVDWRNENSAFDPIAAYYERSFNLAGENEPERVRGASISADLFRTLGVSPVHGRDLLATEDRPNAERVALISHNLWQRRFNSDANLAGKTLKVNGEDHTIVGVMPPDFKYPSNAELWTPLALDTAEADRGNHYLSCIARLKPGVTIEAAQAQLSIIAQRIEAEHPATNKGWSVRVISLREELIDEESRTVLVALLGAVLFVLLIACANVANLLLARSVSREKEMAIRAALGAGRARVIRQLLTESVLISLAGGALGVLLAMWGIDLLVTAIPEQMPFWVRFDIDARVLLFTLAVSLLTGIIFGLVPALQASKPDLQASLKEGSRSATEGGRRNRLRSLLVVSEIALTLVLLIGAALMMKSFMRLQKVAPGFDPKNVLTLQLWVQGPQYERDEGRVRSFYSGVVERIKALPGVQAVGAVSMLPLDGGSSSTSFVAENHPVPQGEEESAGHTVATPNFLSAIGIPLLRGRDFAETDDENAPPVVIVNEWMARRYFPNDDAVGKRIRLGG